MPLYSTPVLCETCQKPCKRSWRTKGKRARFCSPGCIPKALRSAGGRKGRESYAYRMRRQKFQRYLDRLEGRRISKGDLLAIFAQIDRHGYVSGFRAGRTGALPAIPEYREHAA